jgi:Lrp/AsnC family transcriptional regulator for asnA, asnC and gidA
MIDNLDKKLVLELQEDGRRSYVELANKLGVTEGTIRNRIKRLLEENMLDITAVPQLDKLGYDFIGIIGMQVQLAHLRTVAASLVGHPNVCYLANVTGRYEFIAVIVARSSKEFADFMENVVSTIPYILRTETFVSLRTYKGKIFGLDTVQLISKLSVE